MNTQCQIQFFSVFSTYQLVWLFLIIPIVMGICFTRIESKWKKEEIPARYLFLKNIVAIFSFFFVTLGVGDIIGQLVACYDITEGIQKVGSLFGTILGLFLWSLLWKQLRKVFLSKKRFIRSKGF